MAFKARTLIAAPNEPNAWAGFAPPRVVAGLTIPSRLTAFRGKPPAELLADDLCHVVTVAGDSYPRSSADRNCKTPRRMELRESDGRWPSPQDKALDEFAERQLADPEGVARYGLRLQGATEDEIEARIGRLRLKGTKGIMTLPKDLTQPSRRTA